MSNRNAQLVILLSAMLLSFSCSCSRDKLAEFTTLKEAGNQNGYSKGFAGFTELDDIGRQKIQPNSVSLDYIRTKYGLQSISSRYFGNDLFRRDLAGAQEYDFNDTKLLVADYSNFYYVTIRTMPKSKIAFPSYPMLHISNYVVELGKGCGKILVLVGNNASGVQCSVFGLGSREELQIILDLSLGIRGIYVSDVDFDNEKELIVVHEQHEAKQLKVVANYYKKHNGTMKLIKTAEHLPE